jgi:hypothetical protein
MRMKNYVISGVWKKVFLIVDCKEYARFSGVLRCECFSFVVEMNG